MTTPPEPPEAPHVPNQPPYGPPSYGQPYVQQYGSSYGPPPFGTQPGVPQRASSGARIVTSVLAVLFVAATSLVAWGVHSEERRTAVGGPRPPIGDGPAVSESGVAPSYATPTYSTPTYSTSTYSTPSYTPVPQPTHRPLDGETVNRVFQVYMNALLNRSLSQLRSATCPRLRKTETGTALDGKYINRWKGHSYRIYDSLDYVTLSATVRYVDPNTGGNDGSHTYRWYVTRYPDGHYWVCGIIE